MKRVIALLLATLSLAALPAVARADWATQPRVSVFPQPVDPWASWGRPVPHHGFAHHDGRFVPVPGRAFPGVFVSPFYQPVWIPPQWVWTGWQWALVPGHWSW
ncbi:MAG: hypothetical protein HY294_03915 [Candidatus Rokubacteria bacterium]|nr:hypothetical protein [Candidatus Rokubacteria bacterium]MBI3825122.1 hypothetical protein [Candidatus Rokubacteria bacterium]